MAFWSAVAGYLPRGWAAAGRRPELPWPQPLCRHLILWGLPPLRGLQLVPSSWICIPRRKPTPQVLQLLDAPRHISGAITTAISPQRCARVWGQWTRPRPEPVAVGAASTPVRPMGVCARRTSRCTCSAVYLVHPAPPPPGYHGGECVPESADMLLLLRPGLLLVLPASPRGAKLPEQPGQPVLL